MTDDTKPTKQQDSPSALNDGLERDAFDIADAVIEHAYPNIYNKEKGWWGEQRIPNWGILRGSIARAILNERELCSNAELGDKTKGRARLMCHGLTGTPVGYLREDNTVVFECDVCYRQVRSEMTRETFLTPNAKLSGGPTPKVNGD